MSTAHQITNMAKIIALLLAVIMFMRLAHERGTK